MSKQRKQHSKEFKIQILREIETGTPVSQLSRQHEIHELLTKYLTGPCCEHA